MAGCTSRTLWIVVAAHAAVIAFIFGASRKDLISEPTMETRQTEFGLILDWVEQPFGFGTCVPGTTALHQVTYSTGDEILARPVYRCTGWTRPLLWSGAAVLSVLFAASLISFASTLALRRPA